MIELTYIGKFLYGPQIFPAFVGLIRLSKWSRAESSSSTYLIHSNSLFAGAGITLMSALLINISYHYQKLYHIHMAGWLQLARPAKR